jgi:hypothetical protein
METRTPKGLGIADREPTAPVVKRGGIRSATGLPFGASPHHIVDWVLWLLLGVTMTVSGAPLWAWCLLIAIMSRSSAIAETADRARVTDALASTRKAIDERDQRIAVDVTNRLLMKAAEREANER